MKNVLAVLKRDFIRLVKAPAALVVVVALLVLPSLYAWYNVLGFWNPYNNTGNMRVAVVNMDKGAESDLTGPLNVGEKITDALSENDQLDWQFQTYEDAMADLEAGRDYAVFVIPEDFTQKLLTLTEGAFQQPNIQYYVNMKTGPVSPKITDAGSTALEETINSTFIATVSDVVVEELSQALGDVRESISQSGSQASQEVAGAISSISHVRTTLGNIGGALANAQGKRQEALDALDGARDALESAQASLGAFSDDAAATQQALLDLTPQIMDAFQRVMTALSELSGVAEAAGYGEQLQAAISALEACSQVFFESVMPAVTQGLGEASAIAAQLQAQVGAETALVDQAQVVLDQLDGSLSAAQGAVGQTDALLGTAVSDLQTLQVSIDSLSSSNAISSLVESGMLDSRSIADFMGSPTTVVTEKMYEVDAYGFAMAPLFMNLTFWIGAFMLLVIMRQEVDEEGIENLKVWQRYVSRFALFAVFAVIQAIVCCAGLLLLGVNPANPVAFFVASATASLAYLSIIYALSVLFQHVGKGLCIILVFIQIPSATGLYPLEMMAGFYQTISPFFPFTYGISALREAICGMYGDVFLRDELMLGLYFVLFMVLGLVLRPCLANANHTFAKQLEESGIYNSEEVEVPGRNRRVSGLTRAIIGKPEYRQQVISRYERFKQYYPRLIRGAIVLGVAVPLGAGLILGLSDDMKATLLTVWLVWMVLLLVFLVAVESLREGFEHQLAEGALKGGEGHE